MSESQSSVISTGISKHLPTITILAFILAFFHELGLCWGLGFNALKFYAPSDFLAVSIQFIWISLLPYSYAILQHFYDPFPYLGDAKPKVRRILLTATIAFGIGVLLFGILIGFSSSTLQFVMFACVLMLTYLAIGLNSTLYKFEPTAFVFLLSVNVMFSNGTAEGDRFRKGEEIGISQVTFSLPPTVAKNFFLIRLLSTGALVADENSVVSFVRLDDIQYITTKTEPKDSVGILCQDFTLAICENSQ